MKVVIIGAGIAGLSAGVLLARQGVEVEILERLSKIGGRIRKVELKGISAETDFGQHLLMGAYEHTLKLSELLGSLDSFEYIQEPVPIYEHSSRYMFESAGIYSPVKAWKNLKSLNMLSAKDKLLLAGVVAASKIEPKVHPYDLDLQSAHKWLSSFGLSSQAIEKFFAPLCVATLNTPIEQASALMFATVLSKAFFSSSKDATPILPKRTLHHSLIEPAVEFIQNHGGTIRTGTNITRIQARHRHIEFIESAKGERFEADKYIIAVPNFDIQNIVHNVNGAARIEKLPPKLGAAPIVTVYLSYAKPILGSRYAGVLGSELLQWVFEHERKDGSAYLAVVISDADKAQKMKKKELFETIRNELPKHIPAFANVEFTGFDAIKAGSATFRSEIKQSMYRIGASGVDIDNLYVAGDWTDTGLPSTIESAVKSGFAAFEAVTSNS